MTVAYSNRTAVSADIEAELGADRLSLDELLATSDVVTINCPYSTETHHLIGPEQFELMRSSAYLVNTARGPIVDEAALVEALRSGAIAGAGLDVYEHEPTLEPGLDELDNAVLDPAPRFGDGRNTSSDGDPGGPQHGRRTQRSAGAHADHLTSGFGGSPDRYSTS